MPHPVHQPHDKGYKYLFKNKDAFLQLLRSFVPATWVQSIDPQCLVLVDKSYITQEFADKEADIVYRLKSTEDDVIFYVLLELQSTVDYLMPFRLLLYMVEIWREVYSNTPQNERESKNFRLPAIVPLVLYNGRPRWTAATSFQDILAGNEQFAGHLLNFNYELISVQSYSDQHLMRLANLVAAVFMLDKSRNLKQVFKTLRRLQRVLSQMTPDDFQRFKTFLRKIIAPYLSEKEQARVEEILQQAGPEEGKVMVTNIERILAESMADAEQRGIQQGIAQGMAQGMAQGLARGELKKARESALAALREGLDPQLVSKITGLPQEEVLELQKKIVH
ncbi:Rpn family recombination-promoting nuclease/putative transposase [Desulfurispora thermophila]|uniref:Rpn family recombination-promoting nuclease/putative transposase n=1 Tax=Desulfurispora thermophila TaxID=265470 RepID=UPI0003669AB7|nr:Rpn family recombination-promoting nuclease/putative transposase [Desulfurispora thermophila]